MSLIDLDQFINRHGLTAFIEESDPPEGWVDSNNDWEHYRAIISRVTPESIHFGGEPCKPMVYIYSVMDEDAPSLRDVLSTICYDIREYEGIAFEEWMRLGEIPDTAHWRRIHAIGLRQVAAARVFFGSLIEELRAAYDKPVPPIDVEDPAW